MLARTLASFRLPFSKRPGVSVSSALLKTAAAATLMWLGADVGAAWGGDGLRALTEPRLAVTASAARIEPTAQGGLRLSLALSQPVESQIFTLKGPDRMVLDLPELRWGFDPQDVAAEAAPAARARGFLGLRVGLFREGRSRLVLDLSQGLEAAPARISRGAGGYGAVMTIDLTPPLKRRAEAPAPEGLSQRPAAFAIETGSIEAAARIADAAPAPARIVGLPEERELRLAPVPRPRPSAVTIVIDPGHGGKDPGAHYGDIKEKDLVLEVARELRDELRGSARVRVLLTRDSDRYLTLNQRVAVAREARATLFLSIHADALPESPEVSGASFYTLADKNSDDMAALIARRENAVDGPQVERLSERSPIVRRFLASFAQRRFEAGSNDLVREMVANFDGAGVPLIKTSPHRQANLRVLRNFDQPSLLVELGFLTSLRDQRRFKNPAWKETAAQAMAAAIKRWLTAREQRGEVVASSFFSRR